LRDRGFDRLQTRLLRGGDAMKAVGEPADLPVVEYGNRWEALSRPHLLGVLVDDEGVQLGAWLSAPAEAEIGECDDRLLRRTVRHDQRPRRAVRSDSLDRQPHLRTPFGSSRR